MQNGVEEGGALPVARNFLEVTKERMGALA